jgi:hypothetical protein
MIYKIIQTNNYLLIVDDSKFKSGDWGYNFSTGNISRHSLDNSLRIYWNKIIAHLPINQSLILEGVDLLPPIENASELSQKWYNTEKLNSSYIADIKSFEEGYNKAKEKYKYTEEDLRMFMEIGISYGRQFEWDIQNGTKKVEKHNELFYSNIKSLQQPKMPVGFECQSKVESGILDLSGKTPYEKVGQTVWVGKYIYETNN